MRQQALRRGVELYVDDVLDSTAELPTGVLTFLFTDVVDSTALWEQAPELMDAALHRHDTIIEATVAEHGGLLLKHKGEGDSTFCVFVSTPAAVAAAVDVRRALSRESWPERAPIVVRVGLHTGESILRGRDYYGRTINRAARVRAVAVGGQIVLSGAAALAAGSDLPSGVDVRFLRQAVLKGIEGAEEIYELIDSQVLPVRNSPELVGPVPLPSVLESVAPSVFIGRATLLHQIDAALRRTETASQVVLLGGEPGAGKTTLAAVAARSAHGDGRTVLFGSCSERTEGSYEPFRSIVDQYIRHAPREVLASHISAHGGEVGRLTRAMRERMGDIAPVEQLDPETTRALLEDAVIDLLERAAEDSGLLLVVDDAQWADAASMALLTKMIGSTSGVLLVATYRSAHAVRLAPLRSGRSINGTTDDLSVDAFQEDEVRELLQSQSGGELGHSGEEVARHLLEQTGGNPFFVQQLLRHFRESGLVAADGIGQWKLDGDLRSLAAPDTISAVVGQRLERLGAEANRVLGVAAVVGRRFDSDLVAHVLGADEVDVVDAIEAAIQTSLVREVSVGSFEFSHALVHGSIYDDLGQTRTALRHGDCALAMEELHGDAAPAAVVALHHLRSRKPDRKKLVHWAKTAGLASLDGLAPEEALTWFQHALAALEPEDLPGRLDVLIETARAERWVDSDAFRQTLIDAGRLAEEVGDESAFVRIVLANNRGGASRSGEVDTARLDLIERALELVGTEDSVERAQLLGTLAIELSQGDDPDLVERVAADAIACAEATGEELALLGVLLHTTEATRIPSTLEQRTVDTARMLDIAARVGDPRQQAVAALRDVRVKIEAARFDEVKPPMEVMEQFGHLDPYVRQSMLSLKAVVAHISGDIDGALGHAGAAREAMRGEDDGEAIYMATTSFVLWDRGQLGELAPMIEATVERYPAVTGFRAVLAAAYCDADRFDEAGVILSREASNGFAEHPMNPLWLLTMSMFASAAIEVGDPAVARTIYSLLEPWSGRANAGVVAINGLVSESLAGLAVVAGAFDTANRHAIQAAAQAERVGAPISLVRTRLAQCRLTQRRLEASQPMAVKAPSIELDELRRDATLVVAEAQRLGLGTVQRRAETLLASLGGLS